MTERDHIEFTDRERFIVSYYRASQPVGTPRQWLWDSAILGGSLVCIALLVSHGDMAFGFVAYALVVGRLLHLLIEGRRWSRDFRSIFAKYDAKVKELAEALERMAG